MTKSKLLKGTIILLIITPALTSSFAIASSKQKPPTVIQALDSAWYQPILQIFTFN